MEETESLTNEDSKSGLPSTDLKDVKIGNLRITEGLLFAVIPATAYVVSYFYNVGYLARFGITMEYIKIDTTQIILGLFVTAPVFFAISQIATYSYQMVKEAKGGADTWTNLIAVCMILMMIFLYLAIGTFSKTMAIISGLFFGIMLLLLVGYYLIGRLRFWRRNKKYTSIIEGLEKEHGDRWKEEYERVVRETLDDFKAKQEKAKAELDRKKRRQKVWSAIEWKSILIYLSLVIMILTLGGCGYVRAMRKATFPVINRGNSECAVVYIRNEQEFCVFFDRANKKLLNKYIILDLANEGEILHVTEDIGPFQP